jgi:hypothetical protein
MSDYGLWARAKNCRHDGVFLLVGVDGTVVFKIILKRSIRIDSRLCTIEEITVSSPYSQQTWIQQ